MPTTSSYPPTITFWLAGVTAIWDDPLTAGSPGRDARYQARVTGPPPSYESRPRAVEEGPLPLE